MSDDTLNVRVEFTPEGEERIAQALSASLRKSLSKLGPDLANQFTKAFKTAFGKVDAADPFREGQAAADRMAREVRDVGEAIRAVTTSADAARRSVADSFDPRVIDAFESALRQVVQLQDDLEKSGGDPELIGALRTIGTLARSELTAARTQFQQLSLASREAGNAIARDTNQKSRERIAILNKERALQVTQLQTATARELAITRAGAQEQVALTRAAAQRRAAAFELVGRVVRSTERVIRSAFDGTTNVVSSAFTAMRRGATNVTNNIRQTFSSSNRAIRNDFSTSNQAITNSYRRSFRKNTDIVNSELGAQERRVKEFARESAEEISTIGLGTLGGFALLGVAAGRALRGGFERAATLEDSERALTALLGSAEEARQLRDEVLGIVTGTPFKLDQFAQAATQLVAFNIEAEKVPEYLNAIANAAAVRGGDAAQTIDSLVRVFGQVSAAGRLTGEDLNQLSEAGVPALQILGNAYNEVSGDMRDLISDGAVPANEALQILTDGILKGTDGVNGATAAFEGLAQGLGGTLRGSIGNFSAAFDRLGATIITKFQPLLIDIVQAATKAVDVIALAFASLGDAITSSFLFTAFTKLFDNLAAQIEGAGKKIKPVFDFIADGLVAFGTAVGALAALRRVPVFINALAFAFRRLFAPMNLVIGAGILIGGFVSRLVEGSPELREALERLGGAFGRIATVITDLAADAFNALATAIDEFVTPAVDFLADKILSVAIPAINALATFLVDDVLPPIRRFARFVRTEILPAIGGFLTRAVEIATDAFRALADFVRTRVVPVVGDALKKAIDLGRGAFEAAYNFLRNTFIPFVQSDLIPVLGGIGLALAALATGNLPLAGLLAGGGLAVAAFRNDELRGQIIDFFQGIVEQVRSFFSNLFDDNLLQRVYVGALRVAEQVGRALGDFFSDPRLLAAVAGVAAAATGIAGAFVVGLIRGVAGNIPDLVSGLGDILKKVFGEIFSDPALFAGLIGILGTAAIITSFVRDGRRVGQAFGLAVQEGAGAAIGGSSGTGVRSFASALFGGRAAIARDVSQTFGDVRAIAADETARLNRILSGIRGPFISSTDAAETQANMQRAIAEFGPARVGAQALRTGIGDVGRAIRNFNRTSIPLLQSGVRSIIDGFKLAGREIATAAGIIAGGAFAASFISEALFALDSSGVDRLQAGVGLLATSITTGALIGGPAGAAVGAAVFGVGALTSAFKANEERAERAEAAARGYADAIEKVGDSAVATEIAVRDLFRENLRGASDDVVDSLAAVDFNYAAFVNAVQRDDLSGPFEGLGQSIDDVKEDLVFGNEIDGFAGSLLDAGVPAGDLVKTLEFLNGQITAIQRGAQEADILAGFDTTAASGVAGFAQRVSEGVQELRLGEEAARTFRTRLDELNQTQIDEAKRQVQEAKGALDEAKGAADSAKQALIDFLTGNTQALSLEQETNQGILNIESLGQSIATTLADQTGRALDFINTEVATKVQEARDTAGRILSTGDFTTQEEAAAALEPLLNAADLVGGEAGAKIRAGIEEVLANFQTEEGQSLLSDIFDAEAAVAEAQGVLDAEESYLQFRTRLDPETVPTLVAEAEAAAQEVQESFSATLTSPEQTGKAETAGRTVGKGAGDAAGDAQAQSNWRTAGRNVIEGFAGGITSNTFRATAAARAAAQAAIDAARDQLKIESPSKLTMEIGEFFSEGLADGIAEAAPAPLAAAVSVANRTLQALSDAGKSAVKQIGRGLAEEGGSFVSSVQGVLDDALSSAMTKAQQFRAVGQEIAQALFQQQGLRPGTTALGGGAATELELARLDQQLEVIRARENFAQLREEFGNAARTFSASSGLGRINRAEFLTRGQDLREFIAEQLSAGVPAAQAVQVAKAFRDQLVGVARSSGATSADINSLLNTLGLTNTQLDEFVKQVNAATAAVKATTAAEEERIAAEQAAAANRTDVLTGPVFRDLVVQTPTSDPEAVALFVANRVALSARR